MAPSRPPDEGIRHWRRGPQWILALPVAALACNLLVPPRTPTMPPAPTAGAPTSAPPPTALVPTESAQPLWGTLRLLNDSASPICYVIVAPSFHAVAGSSLWYDVATAGRPIGPGASYDFAAIPPDTYDLHALDCDHLTVDFRSEVLISYDYDWAITESLAGMAVELILQNDSSSEICTVYISGGGHTDMDVATSLAPGASQTFQLQPGPYDLWVADCTGEEFGITFGVELLSCSMWIVTDDGGELAPGCG